MDALFSSVERLDQRLSQAEVGWALIGGVAIAIWGEPRLTRDVELKVSVQRQQVPQLLKALGPDYRQLHENALAGVLFLEDSDGTKIDLLLAEMPFDEVAISRARRTELSNSGITTRLCTPEDLIIYKLLSTRPRDHADAQSVVRRQRGRLDEPYIIGWLRDFELALDDSTLVSTYQSL